MFVGSPWKVVVELFGKVVDKTGLKDSILSQCQRFACVVADDYVQFPPPGTPLIVDLFGIVEHSGIYLGGGLVAELFGDNLLREVSLREFVEGEKGSWVRTGKRIFAACAKADGTALHSEYAVENARAYIRRKRTVRYDLFRNNCHLFSISCISGNFQTGIRLVDAIVRGGISIGVLTHAISHFLNAEKDVVWKPVDGWDRKALGAAVFEETSQARVEELLKKRARSVEENRTFNLDRNKLNETLSKASATGIFTPCAVLVGLAYDAVGEWFSGKNKQVPWKLICWLAAALLYFVSPIDLIPDPIPVVGFADDAFVLIQALLQFGPWLHMTAAAYTKLMTIDPAVMSWIRSLGEANGRLSEIAGEHSVNRDFEISKALLGYYNRRFGIDLPFETETLAKMSMGKWKDWEGCTAHDWKLQASILGCRIVDPHGSVCVWGKKRNVRRLFDEFAHWYENVLLPAIINEKVQT